MNDKRLWNIVLILFTINVVLVVSMKLFVGKDPSNYSIYAEVVMCGYLIITKPKDK